jgi:hypothetical protein
LITIEEGEYWRWHRPCGGGRDWRVQAQKNSAGAEFLKMNSTRWELVLHVSSSALTRGLAAASAFLEVGHAHGAKADVSLRMIKHLPS